MPDADELEPVPAYDDPRHPPERLLFLADGSVSDRINSRFGRDQDR